MPEVTLVSGEKVNLRVDTVCRQSQVFVRIDKHRIAGISTEEDVPNIYLWQEVNGVYQYLGDISFREQEDGSILWTIYVSDTPEIRDKARATLVGCGELAKISVPNKAEILSAVPK